MVHCLWYDLTKAVLVFYEIFVHIISKEIACKTLFTIEGFLVVHSVRFDLTKSVFVFHVIYLGIFSEEIAYRILTTLEKFILVCFTSLV